MKQTVVFNKRRTRYGRLAYDVDLDTRSGNSSTGVLSPNQEFMKICSGLQRKDVAYNPIDDLQLYRFYKGVKLAIDGFKEAKYRK